MKVGYTRVSTGLQNLDMQIEALTSYGCEELFSDTVSGVKKERTGFEQMKRFLRTGDTLVVWRLDRLGRSMSQLIETANYLNGRGIGLHSLQEGIIIDRSTATGKLMFHLFAAFAEFERNLISERSAAGRALARARGRFGGRPEKLDRKKSEMIKTLVENKTPVSDVARTLGVSRTTVYRYLNKKYADS